MVALLEEALLTISVVSELDSTYLPQLRACLPLPKNPYVRVLRFEEVAHFHLVPRRDEKKYRIGSIARDDIRTVR